VSGTGRKPGFTGPAARQCPGRQQTPRASAGAVRTLTGFRASNDLFIDHAVELGAAALTGALQRAGIRADEVDLVISTTITGIAVPSIEARIAQLVGLRPT